jgi:hypothetical protein
MLKRRSVLHFFLATLFLCATGAVAQTNTFPASGNVGIGTTSPSNSLDVIGGSIFIGSADGTANASLHITSALGCCGRLTQMSTPSGGALNLMTGNNGTNWWAWGVDPSNNWKFNPGAGFSSAGVAITPNGNVGIGTSTPGAPLQITRTAGSNTINEGIRIFNWYAVGANNSPGITFTNSAVSDPLTDTAQTWALSACVAGCASFQVQYKGGGNGLITPFFINYNGNVGIGTTVPQYPLSVNGTIQAKEVLVNTGWSDYVFAAGYRVKPLTEVAAFIKANHHLPDIPSEAEVEKNGVSLGDMQAKLLAKIEELTLQMIQLNETNTALEKRVAQLEGPPGHQDPRGMAK